MASTSNVPRIRTLSRILGGVAAGAAVMLSALALTLRAAGPSPADDPRSPSSSSPTLESRLMPLIKAHQGKVAVAVKSLASAAANRSAIMPTR